MSDELVLVDNESERLVSAEESVKVVVRGDDDEDGKDVSVPEVGGPLSCLFSLVISKSLLNGREAVDDQVQGAPRPRLDRSAIDAAQLIRCTAHECKSMQDRASGVLKLVRSQEIGKDRDRMNILWSFRKELTVPRTEE